MMKRALFLPVLVTLALSSTAQISGRAFADDTRTTVTYRPDAWIQLCGLSDGCTIHGLPNPTKGKDVYNTDGAKQTLDIKIEEGEGVRYWITFQNDAEAADTFNIDGCNGNRNFKVNNVQIGFYKRPTAGSVQITDDFKHDNASFDMTPASQNDSVQITLNIVAKTATMGVSYTCPITVISAGDPSAKDTLVTKMTTI